MQNHKTPRAAMKFVAFITVAIVAGGCGSTQVTELDRAQSALTSGNHALAQTSAETYIARHPKGPALAEAYYVKGRAIEDRTAATQDEARNNLQAARLAYIAALQAKPATPALNGLIRAALSDVAYWQQDFATAAEQGVAAEGLLTDPEVRSWTAYRAGTSYQRLGRFDEADAVLSRVARQYPGTEPARRAESRVGVKAFHVQVATFSQTSAAASAAATLKRQGLPVTQQTSAGKIVLLVGPYATYGQATTTKQRLAATYPDALITP